MQRKISFEMADGTKKESMKKNYPVSLNNKTRIIHGIIAEIEKQNKEKEKQMA